MGITVEQIQEAVDRLLPRTLDVSRDEASGKLDQSKVVERAIQIVRTAILFDPEASIHALSLAVQDWTGDLQTLIGNLDKLVSNDLLLTLRDQAPHYIDDLTGLARARTKLTQLSGSVAIQGAISSEYLDGFTSEVEDFVDEHVAPNVQNRNRVVIRDEAKALFASIESQWVSMLVNKEELVAQVEAFAEKDIKASTSADVVLAVRSKLDAILEDLEGSNASEQAALAEQVLVDLAAARAVLSIIDTAESPEGTPVVGPASDGRTPADYLQRSGRAFPEPPLVVELPSEEKFGDSGRIHMADKIIAAGYAFAPDDGDGDDITETLRDATKDFVALGIEVNSFVACAATGLNHRILEVAPGGVVTDLRVTPKLPINLGSDNRYVILEDVLGTYFKDEDESFWTEYTGGASGSNVVVSGSGGTFKPDYRLFEYYDVDIDAKNFKDSGISGDWWPYKLRSSPAQPGGAYAPDAAGIGSIGASVTAHSQSTGTGTASFITHRLTDTSVADFTALGLSVGQLLYLSGVGLLDAYWTIQDIQPGYIELDNTVKSLSGTLSGLDWGVKPTSDRYTAYVDGANFHINSITAGDHFGIRSDVHSYRVMGTIGHVISNTHIYIGDTGLLFEDDTAVIMAWETSTVDNVNLIGPDYLWVDESLYSNLVEVDDIARVYTGGDIEGDYTIEEIISSQVVKLEEIYTGWNNSPVVYLHDPDYKNLFRDDTAEFLSEGVTAGDRLYCHIGSGTGTPVAGGETDYTVDEVISNTVIRLTSQPPRGMESADWHVTTATEDFFNAGTNVYAGLLNDDLAETPGYKLVIEAAANGSIEGSYNLDYDPDNPTDLPEIGLNWLQTADTLVNGEGDESFIFHWYVVPQDDKTPFFAFDESHPSKIDFLDFTDNEGDDNSVGAVINYADKRDVAYLVVDGESYQITGVTREDRFDVTSPAYTIRFADRVDVVTSPTFDWEIWRGLTTDVFTDTTNSPFSDREVGDVIRLDPGGPGQQDLVITEVVSATEVRVAPEIDAGQTGLTYVMFNSVRPGMELVTANRRVTITDIDSEHVLKLERPLPMTAGSDLPWFVVLPGVDLNVSYVADRTPNFIAAGGFGNDADGLHDWVEGSEIHFTGSRTIKAEIVNGFDRDGDGIFETLLVTLRIDLARGPLTYRILDKAERLTKEFGSIAEDLTSVQVDDLLTVWSQEGVFEVMAETAGELEVTPRMPSALGGEHFVVVRGGTESWGRYLLLRYLLDQVSLEDDLDLLKLRLAEVVADFGGDRKVEVVTASGGSFVEDGDEDGETNIVQIAKNNDVEASDRVVLTIDGEDHYTYVQEVDNSDAGFTLLYLYREFDQTAGLTDYDIFKNSVSYVIQDALARRDEVQALYDVTQAFSIPESDAVRRARTLLTELGLDRALDTMDSGDLSTLVDMTEETASYSAAAATAVNAAGTDTAMAGTSTGTAASSGYVAGVDPATGERVPTSGYTSSANPVPEEVETRIALARASEWIFADALTYRAAQLSLDDLRSRRIYELIGEVDSDLITDEDPTLPWLTVTGSLSDRLTEIEEEAVAALDYMIENPDEFEDVETE